MSFDQDLFLSTGVEAEFQTEYPLVPVAEYPAVIDKLNAKMIEPSSPDKSTFHLLEIMWSLQDDSGDLEKITGLKKNIVRQTVFLDVTESGQLALGTGKNVGLGRLRDAVGQNQPGRPWSPSMLVGAVAQVYVAHDHGQDVPRAVVKRVKPL